MLSRVRSSGRTRSCENARSDPALRDQLREKSGSSWPFWKRTLGLTAWQFVNVLLRSVGFLTSTFRLSEWPGCWWLCVAQVNVAIQILTSVGKLASTDHFVHRMGPAPNRYSGTRSVATAPLHAASLFCIGAASMKTRAGTLFIDAEISTSIHRPAVERYWDKPAF